MQMNICHTITSLSERTMTANNHTILASLTQVLSQEPGLIKYYICLCGPLVGVSNLLDVSGLFKGHEKLTPCSAFRHSHLFPLLDVLYRQVGNLTFWTVRCTELLHSGQ